MRLPKHYRRVRSQWGRPHTTLRSRQSPPLLLPTGFCFPGARQDRATTSTPGHNVSFNSASPLKVQSVPKSTVSSQDWEVTELVHSGRNGFLRTTKKEIRGKAKNSYIKKNCTFIFWKRKSIQITQRKSGSFHRKKQKKKWVKSCFWDDDAKIWLESIWHPVRQQNVFLKIHFTLSTRGPLAIDSPLWLMLRNKAKPHRL